MRAAIRRQEGIHSTAIVDPGALLGRGVCVGPYSIIEDGAVIGNECRIDAHALICSSVTMGNGNRIHHGAVVGSPPQDLKFGGEETRLVIGHGNVIREYATLNPGTAEGEATIVGSNCLLMAYSHVAHNCVLGDQVILANSVNLAGHVTVDDYAIIGGVTPVHQFTRIGTHCFVGGGSRVAKDMPPFFRAAGNPLEVVGINNVGLQRRGFSEQQILDLKRAYRIIYRSGLNTSQALDRLAEELPDSELVSILVAFIRGSERGISK